MLFDLVHTMIVRTVKLIEHQDLLTFQFLNIFGQCGNFLCQFPMPEHMNCRGIFLFVQQNPALFNLGLELLNNILIPLDV